MMTTSNSPGDPVRRHYLDSASSEPLHPAAREVLLAALDAGFADPRRLHYEGRQARLLLDNATEATAEALGVRPDEVTFTGSGSEAVRRGLLGLHHGRRRQGRRLVCSAVEHSSVLQAASSTGDPVALLPVQTTGAVDLQHLEAMVLADADASDTSDALAVVAVQHANHEVGTVQPIAEVVELLAACPNPPPLLMDACASAGRIPLPSGWSAAAASAHKWGGPPGVGVLLVRHGARWRAPEAADDRSDPRAIGFENIAGALAAAAALQAVIAEREHLAAQQRQLIEIIRREVAALPDVEVVGDPIQRLPHLVTFSCLYLDGEALVIELDRHGFAIASGSACTAATLAPSHVLEAMGALTHGNVRLSLTRETTEATVREFLAVLPTVVSGLRARVGL